MHIHKCIIDCEHELVECKECNLVYCKKCDKEWGGKQTDYIPVYPYYYPYTISGHSYTYKQY